MSKRFFKVDYHDNMHFIVAESHAHVEVILADVEFGDPSMKFADYRDDRGLKLAVIEISAERAAQIRCDTSDDDRGRGKIPLTDCDIGEWFCSEH